MAPPGGGAAAAGGHPAAAHRHLPLGVRAHPAPARGPVGLPPALHDLRRGRPAEPGEGVHAGARPRRAHLDAQRGRPPHQPLKNQMLSPRTLEQARGPRERSGSRSLFRRYEERCARPAPWTSTTCCSWWCGCCERSPEALAWYRGLWRHVLVDEYQDTNRAQYRIIQLLTEEHRNICVVGDPDQSVYRWRGADIRNILDFEQDYPGRRVVRARAELSLDQAHPRPGRRGHRQQPAAQGQDAVDRERGGRAGRRSTGPGTSTRRPTSSPRRSWACAARACRGPGRRGVLPHQRAVPRARGRAAPRAASRT